MGHKLARSDLKLEISVDGVNWVDVSDQVTVGVDVGEQPDQTVVAVAERVPTFPDVTQEQIDALIAIWDRLKDPIKLYQALFHHGLDTRRTRRNARVFYKKTAPTCFVKTYGGRYADARINLAFQRWQVPTVTYRKPVVTFQVKDDASGPISEVAKGLGELKNLAKNVPP